MKNGLTLSEMAKELERRAANKQDVVSDTRNIAMTEEGLRIGAKDDALPLANLYSVNDIAHDQIAQRIGVPAKYYNRMREEAPELLVRNVNHWFQASPEQRLVRMLDGRVRAFLSNRYQRIENEQIANTVLPILMNEPEVRIESCEITERRMYIKAVFPRIQAEVKPGDVVQSGIAISNSEVGQGSVRVEPLIFRLVCLNGLIVNDAKYSARHVGGRIGSNDSNIIDVLSDEAIKADDHAILLKTRDVVRASFDQIRFNRHVEAMTTATEDKITGSVVEAVTVLAQQASLNEFEKDSVLRHLIEGADLSRYGLLNAVTATAQAKELTYDRATELESLGGNILYMPRAEFRRIAEAA